MRPSRSLSGVAFGFLMAASVAAQDRVSLNITDTERQPVEVEIRTAGEGATDHSINGQASLPLPIGIGSGEPLQLQLGVESSKTWRWVSPLDGRIIVPKSPAIPFNITLARRTADSKDEALALAVEELSKSRDEAIRARKGLEAEIAAMREQIRLLTETFDPSASQAQVATAQAQLAEARLQLAETQDRHREAEARADNAELALARLIEGQNIAKVEAQLLRAELKRMREERRREREEMEGQKRGLEALIERYEELLERKHGGGGGTALLGVALGAATVGAVVAIVEAKSGGPAETPTPTPTPEPVMPDPTPTPEPVMPDPTPTPEPVTPDPTPTPTPDRVTLQCPVSLVGNLAGPYVWPFEAGPGLIEVRCSLSSTAGSGRYVVAITSNLGHYTHTYVWTDASQNYQCPLSHESAAFPGSHSDYEVKIQADWDATTDNARTEGFFEVTFTPVSTHHTAMCSVVR